MQVTPWRSKPALAVSPRAWPHVWRDRWLDWRDRLLARPGFQRWAAGFAPTAPIARARAAQLFDLVAGFVYSQVLVACVQLRVFERLAPGPMPMSLLASALGLEREATERLVAAAVALRLLEWRSDAQVGLGVLGAPMVDHPALAAMVAHHAALYDDLRDPVAMLRGGRGGGALASFWPYASGASGESLPTERVADYSALMAASQSLVADEILDAYDFSRHRCVLDVGGGDGSFLLRACERHAGLRGLLFDLPAVADLAAARFEQAGQSRRLAACGGNFLQDALPEGADLATLVRVVHDHDDEAALHLMRSVRRALPSQGRLLLAEPMAGTRGARAMGDAYFGIYLFAMGSGKPRSSERLSLMLREAGFARVRRLRTRQPLQTSLLLAECK